MPNVVFIQSGYTRGIVANSTPMLRKFKDTCIANCAEKQTAAPCPWPPLRSVKLSGLVSPGTDPFVHCYVVNRARVRYLFAERRIRVTGQQFVEVFIRGSEIVGADQHGM